jgi:hypothetical protein
MAHSLADRLADPPAVRRLCLAADIESYRSRSMSGQLDLQNRLSWTICQALRAADVAPARSDTQVSGDGMVVLLPPAVDERKVHSGLVRGLLSALDKVNASPGAGGRMRLRVSQGQGTIQNGPIGFASHAVIATCLLLDSPELHLALRGTQAANAAFIVTSDLYQDLVAQGYGGLPAEGFREVRVTLPAKKFDGTGWIQVPVGVPSPAPVPAYGDDHELRERQRTALEAGGTVMAAAALAWLALAGRHDPHLSRVESDLIGMATDEVVPKGLLPEGLLGGGGHSGNGPAGAGHGSGGHEIVPAEGHARGNPGHDALPLGPPRHAAANANATTYASSGEADPPPDTQAAVVAGTGVAAAHGGIVGQMEVVEESYGVPGSGTSVATGVEETVFADGMRSVAVGEVAEHPTSDGIELTGEVERATGTPGHELLQGEDFREDIHKTAWGYEVTGLVAHEAVIPGYEVGQGEAFQADYVGSAETGYHLADLHEDYSPPEHLDPGHHDTHTELI